MPLRRTRMTSPLVRQPAFQISRILRLCRGSLNHDLALWTNPHCRNWKTRASDGLDGAQYVSVPERLPTLRHFKFSCGSIFAGAALTAGPQVRFTPDTEVYRCESSVISTPGQKKGPGDAKLPGFNNRVERQPNGDAVLKITFAELLRSCSCNISPACCGVYVTLAVGQKCARCLHPSLPSDRG